MIHDSIDGDYVSLGGMRVEIEFEFEGGVLIALEGEYKKGAAELEVTNVELLESPKSVDFGNVNIDWGENR
jgi:hypothetical protein